MGFWTNLAGNYGYSTQAHNEAINSFVKQNNIDLQANARAYANTNFAKQSNTGQTVIDHVQRNYAENISNPQGEQFWQDSNGNWQSSGGNNSNSGVTVTQGGSQQGNSGYNQQPSYDPYAAQREWQEEQRRREEEARQRQLEDQARYIGSMASGLTINDPSSINSVLSQARSLQSQAGNVGGIGGTISSLEGLLSRRQSEQGRYDDFMSSFNQRLSEYGGYGVNDKAQIDSAMGELRNYAGGNAFNSELNVDTSTVAQRALTAQDQLSRVLQERERQQGIVDDTRNELKNTIRNFGSAYQNTDYRDSAEIDALYDSLAPIRDNKVDGIELNVDFSDLASQTDGFYGMIDTLRARRDADLDRFGVDVEQFGSSLPGVPEGEDFNLDATAVYSARDGLNDLRSELSGFGYGDRVNSFSDELFGLDQQYQDLAEGLETRQRGVESNAQDLLSGLEGREFRSLDDLNALEVDYNNINANRNKFDAFFADDELAKLTNFIGDERFRLEQEEAVRAAQSARERSRFSDQVSYGTPNFARQFMSDEEYQNWLRTLDLGRDDPYYGAQAVTFASRLGFV